VTSTRTLAAARVAFLIGEATRAGGLLGTATAYHSASGGGAWRMGLALESGAALCVSWQDAAALAAACELVHQASIVHDDAQDGAAMRRGRQSVAGRYGAPVAICVGDHLLASAFGLLAEQPRVSRLIRLFASRISEMAAGQAAEFASSLWTTMTLEHYGFLAGGKAGAAVALPLEGAALLAGLSEQDAAIAGRIGRTLGVAYQVGDDVSDLAADLGHGALNGVVAHALQTSSLLERAELLALLARAREDGLSTDEADFEASHLGPHARRMTQWAQTLLDGIAGDITAHRLGPTLSAVAAALACRLDGSAPAQYHAA